MMIIIRTGGSRPEKSFDRKCYVDVANKLEWCNAWLFWKVNLKKHIICEKISERVKVKVFIYRLDDLMDNATSEVSVEASSKICWECIIIIFIEMNFLTVER